MMSFISLLGTSEHLIRWLEVLFDASVKSIVVLVLAIGLNLTLRRSSAAFRHLIWLLAVTSCLCLPVISVTLPSWRLPVVVPQMLPLTEATPGLEGNLDVPQLPSPARQVDPSNQPTPQIDSNREPAGLPNTVEEASINSAVPSQETGWWTMPTLWTCIGIIWGGWYVDCPGATVDWVGRHLAHRTPKSAHHRWPVGGAG